MKEERHVIELDNIDHGMVITLLNEKRNTLLKEQKPTDTVDDVLIKVIDAPSKTVRVRDYDEAR